MLPVIALVGRPNVGKSTVFNALTQTRDAIVADYPGLTRDRRYGRGRLGERPYVVIDTGGLSEQHLGMDVEIARQTQIAMDEADAIVYLVDARDGLTAADETIAERLRRLKKPVLLLVNKTDGLEPAAACAEFFALGLGSAPRAVAASHGRGIKSAIDAVLAMLDWPVSPADESQTDDRLRIAVLGRPNVGKSTLVNRIVGERRVVSSDHPGTTRDAVQVPFERDGKAYLLIDTAGIRRRGKVRERIEKFSIIKALQAIEQAHVVVLVIDAAESLTDQDTTLLGLTLNAGRALVLAMNKWDGLESDHKQRIKATLERKLPYLDFARKHFISALHGTGVGEMMRSVDQAYHAAMLNMSTHHLNEILQGAVAEHPPKLIRGRRIKLRYAHQGGKNPPLIVIHGNQTDAVPTEYTRYLTGRFRRHFKLWGTPIRIQYNSQDNPYADRKNTLTPRQVEKRRRLMRHVKRS